MGYSIEKLSEENAEAWDAFNNRCLEGTFFHTTRWKGLLEDVLKIDLRYWIIRRGQEVVGILPFMNRTIGFLKGLEPIPYSEFNSILLYDGFNPGDLNEVLALFASDHSFFFLNVNNGTLLDYVRYHHYPSESTGNMILDLQQKTPENIWENFSTRQGQRKFIRRFDEKGFTIREIREKGEIEMFYRYYAENLMRVNGNVLPFTFFRKLLETYSQDEMHVTLLSKGEIYAGGLITFVHPISRTACFEYLSLNRNLPNTYHPTYPLFWEGINWAWDNGCRKISFGRQGMDPNNPRFRIKAGFGAEYVPVHSSIVLLSRATSLLYRLKGMYDRIQPEQNVPVAGRS